jgi:hypothetical protein
VPVALTVVLVELVLVEELQPAARRAATDSPAMTLSGFRDMVPLEDER